jgi:hypothetical protein
MTSRKDTFREIEILFVFYHIHKGMYRFVILKNKETNVHASICYKHLHIFTVLELETFSPFQQNETLLQFLKY